MKNWLPLMLIVLPGLCAEPRLRSPQSGPGVDLVTPSSDISAELASDIARGEMIVTRSHRISFDTLLTMVDRNHGPTTNVQQILQAFLQQNGFDFSEGSGRKLFYSARSSALMLTASRREHEQLERLLRASAVNNPPEQVRLMVHIAEFAGEPIQHRFPQEFKTLQPLSQLVPKRQRFSPEIPDDSDPDQEPPNAGETEADKVMADSWLAILTSAEAKHIMRNIETREGFDLFSAPVVTTLSGRAARITLEEPPPTITDPPFTAPGKDSKARWSQKHWPARN